MNSVTSDIPVLVYMYKSLLYITYNILHLIVYNVYMPMLLSIVYYISCLPCIMSRYCDENVNSESEISVTLLSLNVVAIPRASII